MNKRSS